MRARVVASLLCPFLLTGCVAAALPILALTGAPTAFMGYKTVQLSTGGSASVAFRQNEVPASTRSELAKVERLAIWPGAEGEVEIAGLLEDSGRFRRIFTPAVTGAAQEKLKLPRNVKDMTPREMAAAFEQTCKSMGCDAVVAFKPGDSHSSLNMWSFGRAHSTITSELIIFASAQNAVIHRDTLDLKVEIGGGKIPGSSELIGIAARSAADRIIELTRPASTTAEAPHRQGNR
jgi:hypothetical protein